MREEEELLSLLEEEGFVIFVRYLEENLKGKVIVLLNWKLLVMEVLFEEDAVLVMLLSIVILRSVLEMKKEDVGGLLIRRRLKEVKNGVRDWGFVIFYFFLCFNFVVFLFYV